MLRESDSNIEYEQPAAGMYTGICWLVADYGKQEKVYQGKVSHPRKLKIGIELHGPGSEMQEGDNAGKHFTVFQYLTMSLSKKSNLRPMLESWTGKPLPHDDSGVYFDLQELIGKPCLIQVIHREGADGKIYTNAGAITPLMAGAEVPVMINPPIYFMLDDYTESEYQALPQWVHKKMNREGFAPKPEGAPLASLTEDEDVGF